MNRPRLARPINAAHRLLILVCRLAATPRSLNSPRVISPYHFPLFHEGASKDSHPDCFAYVDSTDPHVTKLRKTSGGMINYEVLEKFDTSYPRDSPEEV